MLKIKVITDKESILSIPQSWMELPYGVYYELIKNEDVSEVFLGVKAEDVQPDYLQILYSALDFLKDNEEKEACVFVPSWIVGLDIGSESWEKLEQLKRVIKICSEKKEDEVFPSLINVYYPGLNFDEMLTGEVLGAGRYLLQKVNEFLAKYKRLNDYEPDGDEIQAGVEALDELGHYPTLVALCDTPTLYDATLALPADVIYMTLLTHFEKSEISKALYEIKSKK
jgi:hypothetical protein